MTSAVDCLREAGCIGEGNDARVLALLTPPTPEREPADTLFVFSACLPSWMSHYLTSHKYTHRCRNTEGEACSAHIKNFYWRCQQGAQRSWFRFRGNLKEKYGTQLRLQPQRLHIGFGVLFLTLLKRVSTPGALVLESIAKSRQMHQHTWWTLQYLGMLAEFLVSWWDSTGIQHLPKCRSIIVNGCEQRHAVSRQQVAHGFGNKLQPTKTEYPGRILMSQL